MQFGDLGHPHIYFTLMKYVFIRKTIHELEVQLANAMNGTSNKKVAQALEKAHDILVHQVAEYVTTAEARAD